MSRRTPWLYAAAWVVLQSGCTVGPDFKAPEPPDVHSYTAPGDTPLPSDQRISLGAPIEGDWWSQFHAAALDSLMREALQNNQDIAAARARVAQAEEEVSAARATLFSTALPNSPVLPISRIRRPASAASTLRELV